MPDLRDLDAAVADGLRRGQLGPAGFSLTTASWGHVVGIDGWAVDRVEHLMSSSKWLTAAVLMTLVDDGALGLDDPVVRHLPDFARRDPSKRRITLRQCLSLTSGLPPRHPSIWDPTTTLERSVGHIAAEPLLAEPGTALIYGGNGFQVAGRVAEVVTGLRWSELLVARLTGPLQMTATVFGDGVSVNPWLAGGARSSLGDMRRFLAMLVKDGWAGDRRVLSRAALEEMCRDQTTGMDRVVSPYRDNRGYALGAWIDRAGEDGAAIRISSHGGAGSIPWLDRRAGYAAHLFVHQPDLERFRGLHGALALSEELEPAIAALLGGVVERGEIPASSGRGRRLPSRP